MEGGVFATKVSKVDRNDGDKTFFHFIMSRAARLKKGGGGVSVCVCGSEDVVVSELFTRSSFIV